MYIPGNIDGCSDDKTVYLTDLSIPRCSKRSWLAVIMFFVYILTMSIMLINLLIAIFRFDHLMFYAICVGAQSTLGGEKTFLPE